MRDINKDYKYFEDYLEFNKKALEEWEDMLNSAANVKRVFSNIGMHSRKIMYILYSMGETTDDMYIYYEKWVKSFAVHAEYEDYVELFDYKDMFSLGVLFEDKKENFLDDLNKIAEKYGENDREASTFIFLDYLNGKKLDCEYSSCFGYFDKFINSDEKQIELANMIKHWYNKQRGAYWYGLHKYPDDRGYVGYWNFECAALAKIYGIPDEQFKDAKYYPYDLSQRNPIVKNEKYAEVISSKKSVKKTKKKVEFALDKRDKNGYDDMPTIAKLAYIMSNGYMPVVEDFKLVANDYDKFLANNKIWCDEIVCLTENIEEQKMLIFAYWLTGCSIEGFDKELLAFGAFFDWKESIDEVVSQLKKVNKNLKYDINLNDFEIEEDEEEDLDLELKRIAEFVEKQNYALLYLDTNSDSYHLFVVRLSDVSEVLALSENVGFEFTKL